MPASMLSSGRQVFAQLGNQRPEEQVGDTPNEQDGRKTLDEFIFGPGLRAHFAE